MSNRDRLREDYNSQQSVLSERQAFYDDPSAALALPHGPTGIAAWDAQQDARYAEIQAALRERGINDYQQIVATNDGAHRELLRLVNRGYSIADALAMTGISEFAPMSEPTMDLPGDNTVTAKTLKREGLSVVGGGGSKCKFKREKRRNRREAGRPWIEDEPRSQRVETRASQTTMRAIETVGTTADVLYCVAQAIREGRPYDPTLKRGILLEQGQTHVLPVQNIEGAA